MSKFDEQIIVVPRKVLLMMRKMLLMDFYIKIILKVKISLMH